MEDEGKTLQPSRWSGRAMTGGFRAMDCATSRAGIPFSDAAMIRPNIDQRLFNVSHYGVMIPNLPEPFCYFSLMAILGTAGNQLIDSDPRLVVTRLPGETINQEPIPSQCPPKQSRL